MFKVACLLALVAVAAATDPNVILKNNIRREYVRDISTFVTQTMSVSKDKRDTCFSFTEANRGYMFKAAREEVPDREKVCVGECEDGREACYKVLGSCNEECPYCVQPQTCDDLREKNRCFALTDCQCDVGDFQCLPANVGVKVKRATTSGQLSQNGFYYTFHKESCSTDGTFNMLPCDPETETCYALEPCESESNECCALSPGYLSSATEEPSTTQTATFTEPTSTIFSEDIDF